jgi:teichuronic acid biosynthesis glycosyltransferase TuaG
MKLISIIVPYYKNIKFIEKAINSILNQTYKNLEIIIIYDDDNLEDLKFLQKIIITQNKIKLIVNKKRSGAGLSRNIGISIANGEYIAFLDSDDYWDDNKLMHQLNFMIAQKKDFTHTSYYIVDEMDQIKGSRIGRDIVDFKKLLLSCDVGLSTVMIKKNLLDTNKFPNLKTKEDFVLWLKLLKQGHKIYSIDKNLTYWRKTKNSLSSNIYQKTMDGYSVYKDYMKMSTFKSILYLTLLSINSLRK